MFERVKEDNSNSIKKATSVLESGGIIAYPCLLYTTYAPDEAKRGHGGVGG